VDAGGRGVGTFKVRKRAGRRATVRVRGIAEVGTYRWVLRAGPKTLARGRVTVVDGDDRLSIAPNRRLTASVT